MARLSVKQVSSMHTSVFVPRHTLATVQCHTVKGSVTVMELESILGMNMKHLPWLVPLKTWSPDVALIGKVVEPLEARWSLADE